MITRIEHKGKLLHECSIEGDTRKDGFFPGHINGCQLSQDRFLLLYTSRGWRGTDDNTSVIFQIRRDAYDGPLIKEGRLTRSIDDWDPLEDGKRYIKAHVHPLIFGVPQKVLIDGRVPEHSGLFVVMWHRHGRYIDPSTGFMTSASNAGRGIGGATSVTEWTQVRLNETGDDLETIQPVQTLRQKGYSNGYAFCGGDVRSMGLTFTPPVPYNADASEWIGSSTFGTSFGSSVAVMKFTYDASSGLYEWSDMGALSVSGIFESSVARYKSSWIISARVRKSTRSEYGGPVAWMRTENPFMTLPDPVMPNYPASRSPSTAFTGVDDRLRLVTNDRNVSPYSHHRNPLYLWDIDPSAGYAASDCRVVFDSVENDMPIREESRPVVDQGKIFPHSGGSSQIIAHRVRPVSVDDPAKTGVVINEAEKDICGIYYAEVILDGDYPGLWSF